MNKILPQNIEVEEAVLASILINSQSLTVASIYLKPSSFYRTAHQKIFEACLSLAKKDHKVDLLTVTNKLREDGNLEEVGGAAYLAKLADEVPVPSVVEQYCNIILDNALKREIIFAGNEIIKLAYKSPAEAVNILDEAQLKMKGIKHNRYRSFTNCSDLVSSGYKRYEDLHNRSGGITGISSGFFAIDSMTCGFQDSDFIIIAGRPSQGKTALAASMVANMASDGISCGIFSLEMSAAQLCDRLMALESRVNTTKFRNGRFSRENWEAIAYAAGKMHDWDFVVDDTPSLSHMELRRQARRMVSQHGIKILFIDYLQLMSGDNKKGRVEEVSSISRNLKACARELKIPVVALCQLNRAVELRNDKRPKLADLRDSGAIEQDADLVMFIYRDEVYNKNTANPGTAEINIAKQRTGPTGTIKLTWNPHITKFDS